MIKEHEGAVAQVVPSDQVSTLLGALVSTLEDERIVGEMQYNIVCFFNSETLFGVTEIQTGRRKVSAVLTLVGRITNCVIIPHNDFGGERPLTTSTSGTLQILHSLLKATMRNMKLRNHNGMEFIHPMSPEGYVYVFEISFAVAS